MVAKTPRKSDHAEPMLTIKQAAERDNCSEKTMRRAIAAGLLEVVRLGPSGRMIRITPEAHAAYRRRRRG